MRPFLAMSNILSFSTAKSSGKKLYDFSVTGIDGAPLDMTQFQGKVVLIANVATKCGYTGSNYSQFSSLLNQYYDQGLRVLLFPCNQFGNQESGDACEISALGSGYNPKFIMTEKVKVNGGDTHPVFEWLKKQASGFLVNTVKWNFTKFLVDRQGNVHPHRWAPNDEPNVMVPEIEKFLSSNVK